MTIQDIVQTTGALSGLLCLTLVLLTTKKSLKHSIFCGKEA